MLFTTLLRSCTEGLRMSGRVWLPQGEPGPENSARSDMGFLSRESPQPLHSPIPFKIVSKFDPDDFKKTSSKNCHPGTLGARIQPFIELRLPPPPWRPPPPGVGAEPGGPDGPSVGLQRPPECRACRPGSQPEADLRRRGCCFAPSSRGSTDADARA